MSNVEIGGFHCHTVTKTIQQIKSRIKEIKEDENSNSLAKIQVCAMFRAGDIRRNVLLKFIRLCMETPCLYPSKGHKYGGRKLTKTYVIEFCYKKPIVVFWGLINIYMSTHSHSRTVQIANSQRISHFFNLRDSILGRQFNNRVTQKLRNSTLLYHKTKNPIKLKICEKIGLQLF